MSVFVSERGRNLFPSVLLQPLGHLSTPSSPQLEIAIGHPAVGKLAQIGGIECQPANIVPTRRACERADLQDDVASLESHDIGQLTRIELRRHAHACDAEQGDLTIVIGIERTRQRTSAINACDVRAGQTESPRVRRALPPRGPRRKRPRSASTPAAIQLLRR